ncbi:MAG: pyridoxal-phosphate dependent enzyme [Candidatus Latescibacterota bacterium]|nr:MAG: pyridoxal-phosphate dependent enzyme [Candidatus Latescibacterota bacterium]
MHTTPMLRASSLGEPLGIDLHLKAELFQKTGSFKVRGALHKVSRLDAVERRRGLVTISAGNHAAALAYAATSAGVACTVVMPANANPTKAEATRAYGAEVLLHGDVQQAFERCHQLERERNLRYIHAFDDPEIIAGAGTLGLECIEQLPDADAIVVPVGGGGLIAGVAIAVKHLRAQTRIYGVEPQGAAAMWKSLQEGRPATLDKIHTVADGLAPPMAGKLNFEIVRRYVDDMVQVSDAEILAAMRDLMTRAKLFAEPAGAAALAALQTGRIPTTPGARVIAVVSGGNIDLEQLRTLL